MFFFLFFGWAWFCGKRRVVHNCNLISSKYFIFVEYFENAHTQTHTQAHRHVWICECLLAWLNRIKCCMNSHMLLHLFILKTCYLHFTLVPYFATTFPDDACTQPDLYLPSNHSSTFYTLLFDIFRLCNSMFFVWQLEFISVFFVVVVAKQLAAFIYRMHRLQTHIWDTTEKRRLKNGIIGFWGNFYSWKSDKIR